jgi:3-hydroxy-9,10-secoandrosta-1,3,5(10)-triene-9,17-dione monooxygenase
MTSYLDEVTGRAQPTAAHDELVRRAAGLREELWAHDAEFDRQRRLTDEAVAAITGAGLMRPLTPARAAGTRPGCARTWTW